MERRRRGRPRLNGDKRNLARRKVAMLIVKAEGDLSLAATLAGCSRRAMYYWIRDYNLYDVVNEAREHKFFETKRTKEIERYVIQAH